MTRTGSFLWALMLTALIIGGGQHTPQAGHVAVAADAGSPIPFALGLGVEAPLYTPTDVQSLDAVATEDYFTGDSCVDWSPDGDYLAAAGRTGGGQDRVDVYAFNGTDLSTVTSIALGIEARTCAWSPNGSHMAVGGASAGGQNLLVYSFNGTALMQVASERIVSWVYALAWSPDGAHLAAGGENAEAFVYSFNGSALSLVDSAGAYSYVSGLDWSPDGEHLAVGGRVWITQPWWSAGALDVYSFNGSNLTQLVSYGFGSYVNSVAWSHGGGYLLACGSNGSSDIVIYEAETWNGTLNLTALGSISYSIEPRDVAWGAGAGHFVVCGNSRWGDDVVVYTFNGTTVWRQEALRFGNEAYSADWRPDGLFIAVSGDNGPGDITVFEVGFGLLSYPDSLVGPEDVPVTIDVLANDTTITGDLLVTNVSSAANGTVEISTDGRTVLYTPRAEWSGNDSFTYRHSDMWDDYPSETVNITILAVNDVPEITTEDVDVATEDQQYSVLYSAVDADGDTNLTWLWASDAGWLSFDPVTRELAGLPNNEDVGSYWVDIRVMDSNGSIGGRNFTLVVENVNDDPVIVTEDVLEAVEDAPYEVQYSAEDVDPTMDVLEWSVATDAAWLAMDGDRLVGVPTNDDVGEWTVTVTVTDGHGGSDSTEFTVTVANTNDPPVIMTVPDTEATEDEEHSQVFEAVEVDVGDVLAWSVEGPGWLAIDGATGVLSGTPDNGDVGAYWIVVIVTDGVEVDSVSFMLTVANSNDPPSWVETASDLELVEGQVLLLEVRATDEDGDALTYGITSTPASGITVGATSGTIRWLAVEVGTYTMEVTATDGTETVSHTFTLTVKEEPVVEPPKNKVPVILAVADVNITEGRTIQLTLSGSDGDPWDVGNLTFTLVSGPEGMVVSAAGEVLWFPGKEDVGEHQVTVSLSDTKDEATTSFKVTVEKDTSGDGGDGTTETESDTTFMALVAVLLIVVIVLLAAMLLMMLRRRAEE